ncbi:hypothetical protein [Paenibacillus tepidiphilus]|uniref:hypothetical protein n=1 Tax=Paenibacillus tepidiphilus TaxID=2608683 RepID=UPI0012387191|nr:hypothetical protein [Paenibacillus tepidiphilus]
MIPKRKVLIIFLSITLMCVIFVPLASAAPSGVIHFQTRMLDTDPWYAKPILWILDKILAVFGGIHDPGDHVFYQGCFKDEVDCGNKVYGLYTDANFNHVIRRGYALFSIAMGFIITAAIVKSGIVTALSPISSTLKVETTELILKCMIGIVLISNFFTLTGSLFQANNMVVSLVYQDIKAPIDLSSYGENLNGDMVSKAGDRIELRDFSDEQSSLGKLIVSFATRGLSIWWEVFYLQRFLFISLLLVLAPLWISMMFYPMLQSITMAAFKELWSQIIAQGIHAGLFWLFFNLFDENIGWFHVTVAMALFIPLSESVRFIFGSTGQTGSKLASAGTMAGMGAILHMGRAVSDVKGGFSTLREKMASGNGNASAPTSAGGAVFSGSATISQNGGIISGAGGKGAAHSGANALPNSFASNMRLVGNIAGGLGKGGMRFAGSAMGTGLGAVGQFAFAEAGAQIGDAMGYRTGAGAVAAGKGVHSWARNTKELYQESMSTKEASQGSGPAAKTGGIQGAVSKGATAVSAGVSSAFKGLTGGVAERNDPAVQRASAEKVYGAIGEVIGGRNGYQIGANFAQSRHAGKVLSSGSFVPNQPVFSVETQDGSFLATQEKSGEFNRISNIGKGNAALGKGQVVAKPYIATHSSDKPFELKPLMQPSSTRTGFLDEVPAMTYDSEGKSMIYQGRTVNPHDFLEKGRSASRVDLRRRNVEVPTLRNSIPTAKPTVSPTAKANTPSKRSS